MLLEEFDSKRTFPEGTGYELITQPSELAWPGEQQPDQTALKIVLQDMALAETWVQTQGWVLEWQRQERLYLFKVPVRFWDGTSVPRSHLGMPLVYEHVESILPQLMTGLFADDPPFMVKPRPTTSMDAARANSQLLAWELKQINAREEIRLGLKYTLLHGIGVWKYGWQTYTKRRKIYRREKPYRWQATPLGVPIQTAQRGTNNIKAVTLEEEVNLPVFEHRNIRHILVDPGLRNSDIRKARFVVDLQYMNVLDLDTLRGYEGYDIPDRDKLLSMLFEPEETPAMNPLEQPALNMFQEFQAKPRWQKSTVDKLQQPLEVAEYWTKDRVYTVLQRKTIIRNEPNPFGKIPFFSVAMSDVLDSWFGIGIGMLIGNEQRMQQGVVNSFLDDLSLNLNGMFLRKRGANVLTQQLRMRPGGIIDSDDDKGVSLMERQPVLVGETQAVLQASDSRAARRTAANEQAVQGAMPSQNSSITRTATGVSTLTSGTGTRLQAVIEQFSYQVFIPLLDAIHEMNGLFLTPEQINKILTKELGVAYQGDTLDLINGQYDFDVIAGARMQAKASMRQTLPLLYQFLLTDPVIQSLQAEGKKIDVGELVKMTFDVTGLPNYTSVVVPMTTQDIQQMQANSEQAKQAAQMQSAAQMESIKTNNKSQLLEQETEARAGQLVIRKMLMDGDRAGFGLGKGE